MGRYTLSVVEDRLQRLAVRAGLVDRQRRNDLVYGSDHGTGFLDALQRNLIAVLRPRSRCVGGYLNVVTFLEHQ